jgi:hypothetical protein
MVHADNSGIWQSYLHKITVGLRVRLNGRPRDHRSEMPMTGLHGNGTVSLQFREGKEIVSDPHGPCGQLRNMAELFTT